MEARHKPAPVCEDGIPSWNAGNNSREKKLVVIYHDESIFYANEGPGMGWHDPDNSRSTRPKGRGKGIIVREDIVKKLIQSHTYI
jgi:hypothetical protein